MKRLSVIFCTYNREKYIYNAMASVANEGFDSDSYEIVIVNNNSTDSTESLCRQFAEDFPQVNVRYFVECNQGLSYARNRGVEESKGEILVFVDDDATVFDGYLGAIDRFFQDYPTAAACGGPIVPVYEADKPRWLSYYTEQLIGGALYEGKQIKPFAHGRYPGGGNSAFRKEVFDRHGLFNVELGRKGTGLIGAEEKDLYGRLSRAGEVFYYLPQMGIHHYIPAKKLTEQHFVELTYSIGKSERIRSKAVSEKAYRQRVISEAVKWAASLVLYMGFLVRLQPQKGYKLLQFRWYVTKGLLEKGTEQAKEERKDNSQSEEYQFTWHEPGKDNPFNKRILDIRSLTWHVIATTQDEKIAQSFQRLRSADGKEYVGMKIENEVETACDLVYAHNGEQLEGIVFKADTMECKWDIYIFNDIFYFVRSWGGELIYKAYMNNLSDKIQLYKVVHADDIDGEEALSDAHFLLVTHAMGGVLPHRVPSFLSSDKAIALYSFSQFGNKACYACFEDITDTEIISRSEDEQNV